KRSTGSSSLNTDRGEAPHRRRHAGMTYDEVPELHFITPIENVSSILEHGIVCNRLAAKFRHHSIALDVVQQRRAEIRIPGGAPLHAYANLYFHARNPMMYRRQEDHASLC